MTISPSLAGLSILTPTTGDELLVHALVHAVMPSEQRATCRTITPSPLKISTPQTRQKYAHGPSCGEQPSARPSPDTATTTATIARGPPRHDSDGNDKALGKTRASYVSISFRCPRLAANELFGEEYSYV